MMSYVLNIVLLVLGFGFVVFFHELGHFLAAKWAGVKVEQFAVGFGQALLSWRKGMGFRFGSSTKEYEQKIKDNPAVTCSLGETEYRFNWIPLGGYVKMLGQDDLKPGEGADDPRAFNRQTIAKRMVIVSAGVIMNVILAAIGFTILFRVGFNVPSTIVATVQPDSPAQLAGIRPGDRILSYDGKDMLNDFTKITLYVALSEEGRAIPIKVKRTVAGKEEILNLTVTPRRSVENRGFLSLGFTASPKLVVAPIEPAIKNPQQLFPPEILQLHAGETITAVNGIPLQPNEFYKLHNALQDPSGQPVTLTIQDTQKKNRTVQLAPHFIAPFDVQPLAFAGMMPRITADGVTPDAPAMGKVLPGDIIQAISFKGSEDQLTTPTAKELIQRISKAGEQGIPINLTLIRDSKIVNVAVDKTIKIDKQEKRYGIGIRLGFDDEHPVVANLLENSPAAGAGIPRNSTLLAINSQPVKNWYQVRQALLAAKTGTPVSILAHTPSDGEKTFSLALTPESQVSLQNMVSSASLVLREYYEPRKTTRPLLAAKWGIGETRDSILQFYVGIKRMFEGSVPVSGMMGPIGMFRSGVILAERGLDWLLWFLAIISANLAVVNFLPIPVVDGGLFVFLILEKIQGKPLSQRTQTIAQYVGLSLILGVFLFVTYQDIMR
jgi:regulator of sigma E protease